MNIIWVYIEMCYNTYVLLGYASYIVVWVSLTFICVSSFAWCRLCYEISFIMICQFSLLFLCHECGLCQFSLLFLCHECGLLYELGGCHIISYCIVLYEVHVCSVGFCDWNKHMFRLILSCMVFWFIGIVKCRCLACLVMPRYLVGALETRL